MNNKDILKYINKLLSKKNKNKKKINLNDISKIYLKEKRKKDKIKILLFNDLQKIDEFEDNAKFSLVILENYIILIQMIICLQT